jgi:hypothetical protein
MVACASPHWGPEWLGGTSQSVNTIISNCVHKNAWALKQLVQTQPAILYLVGQASWNMFRHSFGKLIRSETSLPAFPEDGPYTLLKLTTEKESRLEFSMKEGGEEYSISTRLVITPHFSYSENFVPQYRMNAQALAAFEKKHPEAASFLQHDPRVRIQKPVGGFVAIGLIKDAATVRAELDRTYKASAALDPFFYDPHGMMAGILEKMFGNELTYTNSKGGAPGYLSRSSGPCSFCVNEHWKFPKGCPYGKPDVKKYTKGFLDRVAAAMVNKAAG